MKHTITTKFFLTTVLVTLLVAACGGRADPWEVTAVPTQTPTATLFALPAIERYATETPTPLPTMTPTPNADLVSDMMEVKLYEGKPVRIIGYTIVDYTHMDVYLRSVDDGSEMTIHMDEDGVSIKLAEVGEDGFTHAKETWTDLPEDTMLLSIALDSFIRQGTIFTFQLPWYDVGEEFSVAYLYEQYTMTARDEELYAYSALHTGSEGCSWEYYVPIDSIDCLINSYHEWGTKNGLAEFLAVTDLPFDAVGWYEREGYVPYIDGIEEVDVPTYISEHNLPIDVRLFADWNYLGGTAYFLYKEDSMPDMFLNEATDFPKEITVDVTTLSVADARVEGISGTLITFSDGYDDELFVPDGYVIVFVKDVVAGGCECWSPFFEFTVLGVYR